MQALLFSPYSDEASILTVILQQAGFMVRSVRNLNQAIEAWPERPSDLVVITLSGEIATAIQLIEQIRLQTAVPVIVITERIEEDLTVSLLEAGADLVIQRPYGVRILLSQVKALMRRSAGLPFFSLPTLSQRDVTLDPSNHTVSVGYANPMKLTQLEFRLLFTLMTHVGQIIPTEKIVEHVWGYEGEGNRELVRGLVRRLRAKLEPNPGKPKYILTEAGIGYYFNRFEDPE